MDKTYFFVQHTDCALKKSVSILDGECLFYLSSSYALTDFDEKLDEVFGEQIKIMFMKGKNILLSFACFHSLLIIFRSCSGTMNVIKTKSLVQA